MFWKLLSLLLLVSFALPPIPAWADDPPVGVIGVKDEGTKLTRRRYINFVGAGVTATDDSSTPETDITIPGGGGSVNSFETIAVPAGTNPVADSSTDTLTITKTGPVVVTGTAGTDTLDFNVTTSPASASTVVGTGRTVTIAGTANQIISSAGAQDLSADRTWTLSTPQDIDTGATPTFLDLRLAGTGPDIRLTPTGGDTIHFGAEYSAATGTVGLISNATDWVPYLEFENTHVVNIGSNSAPFVRIRTDGTGDAELYVPLKSIGTSEIADAAITSSQIGSGALPEAIINIPGPAFLPLEAADSIPPLSKDTGTSLDTLTVDFDQSVDEGREAVFEVPARIDSAGTVTFTIWWSSTITSGNVMWEIRHSSGQVQGVTWDSSLATIPAAASAVQGTTDQLTKTTFTATVSNLAWAASDYVTLMLYRNANHASDTMAGDARVHLVSIRIPQI